MVDDEDAEEEKLQEELALTLLILMEESVHFEVVVAILLTVCKYALLRFLGIDV